MVWIETQLIIWALGGVGVLAVAFGDIHARRDADAWLLGLLVAGTFFFAAFLNWTVNGRTILPMAPAVAILLGAVVLSEPLTLGMAVGFPLVIAGSVLGTSRAPARVQSQFARR